MNEYQRFLKSKQKNIIDTGFDIDEEQLNDNLFDFQKFLVKIALKKGRFAIFANCGLGKTICQLEWAYQVNKKENKKVIYFKEEEQMQSKKIKIMGIISLFLASILSFYLIFYKLTPFLCRFLPQSNEWTKFIKLLVYIIIGWCGGITIPLSLLFFAFYLLFNLNNRR